MVTKPPLPHVRAPSRADWAGPDGIIGVFVRSESQKTLEAYRNQPNLVDEHANHEEDTARGGYAHRQLFELVQNAADALLGSGGGRIWIRLTPTRLYCADEGRAIDPAGVTGLMFSHISPKRGTAEIGRFGLGFKSVLGVTNTPEFFSRSGSFRFDRKEAERKLRAIRPGAIRFPVLRLPEAIDPWPEMEEDPILRDLMGWAVNIVRLPLKRESHGDLDMQIGNFPAEFLLLVEHVKQVLLLTDQPDAARTISLSNTGGYWVLNDSEETSRWVIRKITHRMSPDAKLDWGIADDAEVEVPISWAIPVDRLNDPGKFWAFFPTMTTSLLSGILNAPWKTNQDRQNLLPGPCNDELIDAAASMAASALPRLSTPEDPACHLDALPRRHEAGDSVHSDRLRDQLHLNLGDRAIAPDQNGEIRTLRELSYPPQNPFSSQETNPEALKRWAAYEGRPSDWLHHSSLTRNRIAKLNWLYDPETNSSLPRASVAEWLEALLDGEGQQPTPEPRIDGSAAAIQTAALIPPHTRPYVSFGTILFTADGRRVEPDPDKVFLGHESTTGPGDLVHPLLQEDSSTLVALKELGIKPASSEAVFKAVASGHLAATPNWQLRRNRRAANDSDWIGFWKLARRLPLSTAAGIIRNSNDNWRGSMRVLTVGGSWRSLFQSLIPGIIVPEDGTRDSYVAIDLRFHGEDLQLLRELGAAETPSGGHELSRAMMDEFRRAKRKEFKDSLRDRRPSLTTVPQDGRLTFKGRRRTSGPIDVLQLLSEEGKALYTWCLLGLPATYEMWTMSHETQSQYGTEQFLSPAIWALRKDGRIDTGEGIRKLSDGFGKSPKDPHVLHTLSSHPQSDSIWKVFELAPLEVLAEPIGEDSPVPLVDEWHGLAPHLTGQQNDLELVRCDGFRMFDSGGDEPDCIVREGFLYVARQDTDDQELRSVLRGLGLELSEDEIEWVLRRLTPEDVQRARAEVRECTTDEERLLAAVGMRELWRRLPTGLLVMLTEEQGSSPNGIEAARAAISVFHTSALREYRHALGHLDPPKQWAGSPRAVEFVRSLGFGEEWAGERNSRRDPYVDVDGPYSLPELHDYQRKVVKNVRRLIHSNGEFGEPRGMVSMPTGSGKTRVAVQSIVESIRDDGFTGGILWVADRDELCEQAVEAWRQVWSSEGAQGVRLRISRMWAGQRQPSLTGDINVIVATIQTLSAKMSRQPDSYGFLAEFKLLVFDEAHRSVAPTFTSVMEDLGLTRWRRTHEPLLIGLTATPYRGLDERETARLVNRYSSNRLDEGAFVSDDPEAVIQELQSMSVLARADHSIIKGGDFPMSASEQRQSQQTPWLPRSVENRIAGDAERTRRIIQAYHENIDPDWPTLVFATSVEHSQTVAALLTRIGIKARAVSADTETSIRRRVVEEFRSGEIKALVNYGIFREGFDAPKTRAIIVARPVYSPNLYFQMIGRGLRGVKNGGNDRCLILNVRDNIENFQRKLAFSDLDWLWD